MVARASPHGQTARVTPLLRSLPLVQVLAYGAVGVVLLTTIVIAPLAGAFEIPPLNPFGAETTEGEVLAVEVTGRQQSELGVIRSELATVRLSGGEEVAIERQFIEGDPIGVRVQPGDGVLVTANETPDGTAYYIADRSRSLALWVIGIAFAALVALVGRGRGLWSLVGLAASFLVIVRFIVPAILTGWDPVVATVIGASAIAFTTLVLAHGANWKTAAALGGTALSLALAFLLARFGVEFVALTGLADEHAIALNILSEHTIDARGLLLAGIIIGALGVLDDVTATQSSTVFELRRANPLLGTAELFRRGLNVGRDHIASTVNTLVLAYAGASLPLVVLLAAQPEPLGLLISRDLLATEIVRTLIGSMGIVAAVPITTGIAALLAGAVGVEDDA
ncbi:MAG: YibE/F family protein [Chloroflexi bacterium]|nr:YibE/F family protein [Chloroflexota bacterium]